MSDQTDIRRETAAPPGARQSRHALADAYRHIRRIMRTGLSAWRDRATGHCAAGVIIATVVSSFIATVPALAADCNTAARPSIDWKGCDRRNLMISNSNLQNADLEDADLSLTDLHGTDLTSANLTGAKLVRASLAGAKADGANFSKVEGYRTIFSAVSAKNASFQGAELQRADFSGATLANSNFQKAELGRVNFSGARIADGVFAFANLARADFRKARLSGALDFSKAYMFLTRLEGADLSSARGLTQPQIDLACGDAKTRLPAGLKPPAAWPCKTE